MVLDSCTSADARKMAFLSMLLLVLPLTAESGNIGQELKDLGRFFTLKQLTDKVGLTETLVNEGPFTVFAPTNEAFAKANVSPDDGTPVDLLKKIVSYHVLPGKVFLKDLQNDQLVNSVEGTPVRINFYNGTATVNGAKIEKGDIEADNGVIHILEAPMVTLPTGKIHEFFISDPRFSVLLSQTAAAGLTEALSQPGPFTVFAPTDEAFAKISKEQLDGLTADPAALKQVVLRHILSGTVFKAGLLAGGPRATLAGSSPQDTLNFAEVDGTVQVKTMTGSAKVTQADWIATNGVVHVIDTVL